MKLFVALGALIAMLAFPASGWAVDEDITPPQLDALSITPTSVDVTSASQTVTATATITDPAAPGGVSSGATGGFISYSPPSGGRGSASGSFFRTSTSGDEFKATITFPRFISPGTWKASVSVSDRVGNFRSYSSAQLATAGFNVDVEVTSDVDNTPPVISNVTVGPPTAVTVSPPNGPQSVPATATITDDKSGVSSASISYRSPSGRHSAFGFLQRTTGDQFSGQIIFRPYQEAGTWSVSSVSATDVAGNPKSIFGTDLAALNLPDIQVTSDPVDFEAPKLESLTAVSDPPCADPQLKGACVDATGGDRTVTIKATITDNLAGVSNSFFLSYVSPGFGQQVQSSFVSLQRKSGDNFEGTLTIRQFAKAGFWKPSSLSLFDNAGNSAFINQPDFKEESFVAVSRVTSGGVNPGDPPISTGDTANDINPIQSSLSIPPGGTGGQVDLKITPRTLQTPPNFYLLDQQLDITAPDQPDTSHPMKIEFLVDASVFAPGNPQVQLPPPCVSTVPGAPPTSCELTVYKNGVPVEKCTAVPPSPISPDPCIADQSNTANGDVKITIYTTTASSWNVGIDLTQGTQPPNHPPVCTNVKPSKSVLWPPNHQWQSVQLQGGSDEDGDDLTFTIKGITQDEPVKSISSGNTAPDARINPQPGKVYLRAERNGNGDGRVYRIEYELSDGTDSCTGFVKVSVPKNQSSNGAARDSSPPSYNSLGS
jgi:hypothetical protein